MYHIKTECHFDAAHFLKDHPGACRFLHGHRWRVSATLSAQQLNENPAQRGMILDFKTFKDALKKICGDFDHCFIFEKDSLKMQTIAALKEENFRLCELPFRPTAENLARVIFERLSEVYPVYSVEVYETPTQSAIYQKS